MRNSARATAPTHLPLSMHNICAYAACGYGTEAFKAGWAHDLTSGRKLANFALTEPQSGSDAANMYTRASFNGDGTLTISGAKAWVSLAGEADVYLTVVKTSEKPGHADMAMIAIPADAEGLSFGPRYQTPSYAFLPLSEMYMEKVVVSEDNIILPPGQGLQGALMAIDIARVSIASGCCGLMESALDTALAYARNRKMFGGVNLDLDGIQWMLGDVMTELEASRLLYRSAANKLGTPEGPVMAAHAKRFVPDAAVRAAKYPAPRCSGGMGLLAPYGLDRLSRLAQMLRIVDGTTEVSRVDRTGAAKTRGRPCRARGTQGIWRNLTNTTAIRFNRNQDWKQHVGTIAFRLPPHPSHAVHRSRHGRRRQGLYGLQSHAPADRVRFGRG